MHPAASRRPRGTSRARGPRSPGRVPVRGGPAGGDQHLVATAPRRREGRARPRRPRAGSTGYPVPSGRRCPPPQRLVDRLARRRVRALGSSGRRAGARSPRSRTPANAVAISQATYAAAEDSSRPGTSLALVRLARLVHGADVGEPVEAGSRRRAGADRDRVPGGQPGSAPWRRSRRPLRSPSRRPCAADQRDADALEPRRPGRRRPSARPSSRGGRAPRDVVRARHRLGGAGDRAGLARAPRCRRSSVFLGTHAQYEHSPPTSSCSTSTTVSPAARARSATFSPTGPPPRTTTRSLLSHDTHPVHVIDWPPCPSTPRVRRRSRAVRGRGVPADGPRRDRRRRDDGHLGHERVGRFPRSSPWG